MILQLNENDLRKQNAYETAREITHQPSMWLKTWTLINKQKGALKSFLKGLGEDCDIVFLGAGTSEYVGNVLEPYFNKDFNFNLRSVPSTDMITEPDRYVHPTRPTLCISYGRSGNSPESVGSVHAANTVNKNLYHLFITCNKNGALAELAKTQKNTYALILPDETNDLGFAMTSSFTSMYLSTVLVFKLDSLDETKEDVEKLAKAVEYLIEHESAGLLDFVNNFKFERIIYLGSNLLKGIAQESALKVLELTAGNVATLFDTPTGFRHGPKSFINDKSLIVVYLSDDPLTRRYEVDLLKELGAQKKGYKVLVVHHEDANVPCDYKLNLNYDGLSMDYVALKAIVVAHLIGFYKSYTSGITTDNPCPTGEVNRVVTGVTIYPVKED